LAGSSKLSSIKLLGYISVGLFSIVMILQLMLASGILPISMAWGGRHTELTLTLRFSSLIAIILLCYFAYMIARRSGIMGTTSPSKLINIMGIWAVDSSFGSYHVNHKFDEKSSPGAIMD